MRYAYFDSEITGTDEQGMPIFDRAESSEMFAMIFEKLLTNGILAQPADCFQVQAASGSDLTVTVQPGFAVIKGRFAFETNKTTLVLSEAPRQYKRIDRVILRCNYVDRTMEIIVKEGDAAASPKAKALIRPASGDYYELCLADIEIKAGIKQISQEYITDRRPDSAYCGYVTQFIKSIDTSVFFQQFNAFYNNFVNRSESSYNDFIGSAQSYVDSLRNRGDTTLAETSNALKEFSRSEQENFNNWFDSVRGRFSEDVAGHLTNVSDDHEERLELLEKMIIKNDFYAPIDDGESMIIIDDSGYAIVGDWKYKEV